MVHIPWHPEIHSNTAGLSPERLRHIKRNLASTIHRFHQLVFKYKNGIIPPTLKDWSEDLQSLSKKSVSHLNKLYNGLIESVKDGDAHACIESGAGNNPASHDKARHVRPSMGKTPGAYSAKAQR